MDILLSPSALKLVAAVDPFRTFGSSNAEDDGARHQIVAASLARNRQRKGLVLPCAIGRNLVLQNLDTGVAERCGGIVDPAILLGERRDALAVTVCLPRRPGEPCGGRDEAAAGDLEHRTFAVRPPLAVAPNRLPSASAIRLASGVRPSSQLVSAQKLTRMVGVLA
jgi:hypothetical protein